MNRDRTFSRMSTTLHATWTFSSGNCLCSRCWSRHRQRSARSSVPLTREWKWVSFTVTTQTLTPAISAQIATLFQPNTLSSTVSNGMSALVPSEKICQISFIASSISFFAQGTSTYPFSQKGKRIKKGKGDRVPCKADMVTDISTKTPVFCVVRPPRKQSCKIGIPRTKTLHTPLHEVGHVALWSVGGRFCNSKFGNPLTSRTPDGCGSGRRPGPRPGSRRSAGRSLRRRPHRRHRWRG